MAGGYAGWTPAKATAFRNAIHLVAAMAQAPTSGDDVTFHWDPTSSTGAAKDSEGVPFDPHATVTSTPGASLKRPYLIEYIDAQGEPTTFGTVVPSRVRLWMLDVDYVDVQSADYIVIKGDRYNFDHEPPPTALFDVELHQLIFSAVNET